jgi:O-antigen/teichoic acid export membrane protein
MIKYKFLGLNFYKFKNKRINKNFSSQVFLNISLTISQILFPALMIMFYGLENFGIWIFLTAIPTTLTLVNFNFSTAAKTEMSIYFNKKNIKKINEIFTNCIILTLIFVLIFFFLTIIFIDVYDFNFEILKKLNSKDLKIIITCIFLSFYLDIINGIFKTGISYSGRLDVDTYLQMIFDILSKLAIIISGIIFGELLFASYALIIVNIVKIFSYYFFFISFNKYLNPFSFKLVSKKQIIRLIKISLPYHLDVISGLMKNSFQIIILGIFFNAQIVGLVSTFRTLFYFLPIRIWGLITKVIFYEFTKLYANKKYNLLKKTYFNLIKIISISSIFFILISIFMGQFVYNLWINFSYNFDYLLLLLIIFDVCIFELSHFISIIKRAINKFLDVSLFSILINSIILSVAYGLFVSQQSYLFLFILNLIGSIMIFVFNLFRSRKILSKFKY